MNAAQVRGIARFRGPVVAVLLAVVVAWLGSDLFPQVMTEVRLRKATELVRRNPARALEAIEKSAERDAVSQRQRERGIELAQDAMNALRGERPLLRLIGRYVFDPATASRQYVTAGRGMMLTFELPASLSNLSPKIRVSAEGYDLCEVRLSEDGRSGSGEVPLGRGQSVVADVDIVLPIGAYGSVTAPIAHGLHLSQQSQGPSLKLRAGDRVVDLRDEETVPLQVDRGTPLRVELSDELGLSALEWSLDKMAHDPFDWSEDAEASRKTAPLPDELTAQAANRRLLELKALNLVNVPTRALVELLVREPTVPPVESARIDKHRLEDGAAFHAGEKSLTLVVTMAKGEFPEGLSVIWNDRPQKTHVNGQEVTALLTADVEGTRSLLLEAGGQPLLRSTIRFDWTAPSVNATLDPGRFAKPLEVRKAFHEAPIGSIVTLTIADDLGLDRSSVQWGTVDGSVLEDLGDEEPESRATDPPRAATRRYRCSAAGEAIVRTSGSDLAGNRTTIHEFRIKTADPMAQRVLTVNGKPFPGSGKVYSTGTRFEVRTEGGIDVDGLGFYVLDPDQQNSVLGQVVLGRTDQASGRLGILDLSFVATSARRVIGVLARNERELAKGEIMIDFARPTFRVLNLDDAGARNGVSRFFAQPGERVSVTVLDDVRVDVSTISVQRGASIEDVQAGENEAGVVLLLPAVFEDPVVMTAADEAGNLAELRFEAVVQPESGSRPASAEPRPIREAPVQRPTPDAGPPPPESRPSLAELEATPKVTHALLGMFHLVGVRDSTSVPPFYIAEHELLVKQWRLFVGSLQSRSGSASANDPWNGQSQALAAEAARLLNRNTNVLKKGEDEPVAGATPELVKAYVKWANEVAHEHGVWKVPTAAQWRLAAGRANHPQAIYPTTALFPSGNDLSNEGSGGALFGRDILAASEAPKRLLQPGAFGLRGMAGSLNEWVVDTTGRLRLIGGSLVSSKESCRLDAPLKSGLEVAEYERGLRLVLLPRKK